MLKLLDLFSGIGGFSLAARWTGAIETAAFVEIDEFCKKVLKKHWPNTPIISDIREVTGERIRGIVAKSTSRESGEQAERQGGQDIGRGNSEIVADTESNGRGTRRAEPEGQQGESGAGYGHIDILTGGFPCQPFSAAGKRKGKTDDRYLWPEMLRVIAECKPTWIIGENVAGLINMAQPDSQPEMDCEADIDIEENEDCDSRGILGGIIDDLENLGYEVQPFVIPACAVNAPHRRDRVWIVAYSVSRSSEISNSGTVDCENGETQKCRKTDIQDSSAYRNCHAPDTARELSHGSREPRGRRGEFADKSCSLADTSNQGLPGREWPGPHEQGQATHGSTSERNHTWDEPWIEVATRLCRVDDGLPSELDEFGKISGESVAERKKNKTSAGRVHRLKALGNAIVPQVAYEILKTITEINND